MEKAKNVRRAAKSAFTRALNAGQMLLDSTRPLSEVHDAFEELKAAYADLIAKHEEHTMYLEDEEYPAVESWMEEWTLKYVSFLMRVNDYCHKPCEDKEKNAASVKLLTPMKPKFMDYKKQLSQKTRMHKATQPYRTPQ